MLNAQTADKAHNAADANKPQSRVDVDPTVAMRRQTAVSLVSSLADEARNFRDERLRGRIQARAADALWSTDKKRARELFRMAWESATASDTEAQRRYQEKLQEANAAAPPSSLRVEVLRLTSKRDRALADKFLEELTKDKNDEGAKPVTTGGAQAMCPGAIDLAHPALSQRIAFAQQLLSASEMERALQIADPVLICTTAQGLSFLSELRAKNPEQADRRYAELLERASADASSDANTISLLSSYVLTLSSTSLSVRKA